MFTIQHSNVILVSHTDVDNNYNIVNPVIFIKALNKSLFLL